ncbi:unnamed protein product [Urochloa humidicola]
MAPFVPDDLLLQVFLRLPRQPSCLLRASLVCKRWRGLVADPRFLRQLRAPLLGVFLNIPPARACFFPAGDPPDRVPASRFHRPPLPWLVRASRRGRVLLCDNGARFLVWDPVTNAQLFVPAPPVTTDDGHYLYSYGFGAVLLRGDDVTDTSFRVAVAFVQAGVAFAAVYSSDTGAWAEAHHVVVTAQDASAPASGSIPWVETPGAAAGDAVYWLLDNERLLSLELHAGGGGGPRALAVAEPRNAWRAHGRNVKLMRTPGGELGLAAVTSTELRLWALEEAPDGSGAVSWTLHRTVLLDTLLPGARMLRCPVRFGEVRSLALALDDSEFTPPCARIVGVDEDGAVVFLRRMDGLFMIALEATPRAKKIYDSYYIMHQKFDAVYPFTGFFVVGNI